MAKVKHDEVVRAFRIWILAVESGMRGTDEDVYELVRQFNAKTNISQEALDIAEEWFNWKAMRTYLEPDLYKIRSTHPKARTSAQWSHFFDTTVVDPDGWRGEYGDIEQSTKISAEEFAFRWARSTCKQPPPTELQELITKVGLNTLEQIRSIYGKV